MDEIRNQTRATIISLAKVVGHNSGGQRLNRFGSRRKRSVRTAVNGFAGSGRVRVFVNTFHSIGSGRDGNARSTEAAVLDQLKSYARLAATSGATDDDTPSIRTGRFRLLSGRRGRKQLRGHVAENPRPAPKELRFGAFLLWHLEEKRFERQQRRPELGESNFGIDWAEDRSVAGGSAHDGLSLAKHLRIVCLVRRLRNS